MSFSDPGAPDVISRTIIRMPYLANDLSADPYPLVHHRSQRRMRKIAEVLALQFKRETRFDFVPYDETDDRVTVVLIPSKGRLIGGGRLISGAIGIGALDDGHGATWIYIHPYDRGRRLVDDAWAHVTATWAGVRLVGPFTEAGEALRRRLEGSSG